MKCNNEQVFNFAVAFCNTGRFRSEGRLHKERAFRHCLDEKNDGQTGSWRRRQILGESYRAEFPDYLARHRAGKITAEFKANWRFVQTTFGEWTYARAWLRRAIGEP